VLILEVESGRVGRVSKNPGGSYDMGPMQINSFWLPILAGLGLGERAVTDHGCVNLAVGAWILRSHLERTGSLARAISEYHSPNPRLGRRYLLAALSRLGRLDGAAVVRRANRGLGDRP
jgi:soluble lytic murein transglycosylase-like protein